MTTSLHDLGVPTFPRTVSAVAGFLDRAARRRADTAGHPDRVVNAHAILRTRGLPIGKRDDDGRLRARSTVSKDVRSRPQRRPTMSPARRSRSGSVSTESER